MIPVIVSIGPIPVHSFGLMVAVAALVGVLFLQRSFAERGLEPAHAEPIAMWALGSGIVGARLWYLVFEEPHFWRDPLAALFSTAGFVFYGGFIIAALVVVAISRRRGIAVTAVADCVGPALAVGYAIGRLGCQLSGDGDYGMPVDSWLGMSYATGVVPTPPGVTVYPTPIYESFLSLIACWWLIRASRSSWGSVPLRPFGLYLVLLAIERFLVEFIRIEPRYALGLSQAQWIAVALFVVGLALISQKFAQSQATFPNK